MRRLKAAVIGLGNIGFQLSLDNRRKGTWSHVAAYERCAQTELAGTVEVDGSRASIFKRYHKGVPVFGSVKALMENTGIDMVSICTPTPDHYRTFREVVTWPVKAIFCEKPLAASVAEGREMVRLAERKGVVLAVNHTRRWDNSCIRARQYVASGVIGEIRTVSACYPGRIFNIGSHLFDAIRMLTGREAVLACGFSANITEPDPDVSGWVKLDGGIPCSVVATGRGRDLVFEIDVIGSKGRVRILENGEKVELYSFRPSRRYSGYRELSPKPVRPFNKNDRFVDAVRDISSAVRDGIGGVACSGRDGLAALSFSFALTESARKKSPVKIGN